MVDFNCVNRLLQILSQCMLRRRLLDSTPLGFNVWAHGEWVQEAMNELRQTLADLPPQYRPEPKSGGILRLHSMKRKRPTFASRLYVSKWHWCVV